MIGRRKLICSLGSATVGIIAFPVDAHEAIISGSKLGQEQLSVTDPRPVKIAVAALEKRYGWVVTYEDPPYAFAGELENVSQVPGSVVMDLRTQSLELPEPLPPQSANPDRIALLNAVLAADVGLVGHERFALRSSALGVHVVPISFRDSNGVWSVTNSILDRQIAMPSDELTVLKYLELFCVTLAQVSGKAVTLATVPYRLLASRTISLMATNQSASDVLIGVLQSLNTPLTWRLLCSPEPNRGYYLNIVTPG